MATSNTTIGAGAELVTIGKSQQAATARYFRGQIADVRFYDHALTGEEAAAWMEVVPSFFFVDALHKILNFEADWADVSRNLLMLVGMSVGLLAVGTAVLRRRF